MLHMISTTDHLFSLAMHVASRGKGVPGYSQNSCPAATALQRTCTSTIIINFKYEAPYSSEC